MKKLLAALSVSLILLSVYSCKNETAENADTQNNDSTNTDTQKISFTEEDYKILGSSRYEASEKRPLTLRDVEILSSAKELLSWNDFDGFNYIETGSGLYIRMYDIDDSYKLLIGGGSPTITPPMYIYLSHKIPYERIDIRYEDVGKFIEETSKIKNGTKRFIAEVVQNGEVTVPAGKSEDGMTVDTGKIILSVKDYGNTNFKNDDICNIYVDGLTGNTEVPRLLNGDIVRVELDENTEISSYSFDPATVIKKAVSIQRCDESGRIITPLEKISDSYTLNNAINDNCVVYRDHDIVHGKERFESFLANVKYKSCSNVRLAFYYSESNLLFIQDLYFDGTSFTLREIDNAAEIIKQYKYLRHFVTEYDSCAYLRYVLTDDDTVTYDRLQHGLLSSKYGDYIPFSEVYVQKGFCENGEFFDESYLDAENKVPERILKLQ